MKFSCERCGKKYATAEAPVQGKVYKLKCKACGHVIVVRGAAALPAPAAAAPSAPVLAPQHAVELEPGPPPGAPVNGALAAETTTAVPMASLAPEPTPVPAPATSSTTLAPEDEFQPPPGDTGYVDLFAEGSDVGRPLSGQAGEPLPADPFAAADPALGPADDPFAPMRAELEAAAGDPAPAMGPSRPLPTPKVPELPRPASKSSTPLVALVGLGFVILVGILAWVLMSGKKADGPRPPPPAKVAAAPAPLPAPEPAPQAAAAQPEPAPAAPAEVRPPEPPRAEPEAPPARRAERTREHRREPRPEPKPQPVRVAEAAPAAPQPPAREPARVDLPQETEGLSPDAVQKVLASTRKAFDGCIATAKGSDVKLDGRKVVLRLTINNSGAVTYPTLDDVTLNGTEMGSCLKSAARLMVFPKFRGDPMHVEVPLVLAER